MAVNIYRPQLEAGQSFDPRVAKIQQMKHATELIKQYLGNVKAKQLQGHQQRVLEQVLSGKSVTGTRPQGEPSIIDVLSGAFNPQAEYTGGITKMEMAPYLEAAMKRVEQMKTDEAIRRDEAKAKAQIPTKLEELTTKMKLNEFMDTIYAKYTNPEEYADSGKALSALNADYLDMKEVFGQRKTLELIDKVGAFWDRRGK